MSGPPAGKPRASWCPVRATPSIGRRPTGRIRVALLEAQGEDRVAEFDQIKAKALAG